MRLQPLLHELVTCVCAPTTVLSARDGQVRPHGAQGAYHGDVRVLSRAELRVDGVEPESVLAVLDGVSSARFTLLDRRLGDRGADPSVRVERRRTATASGLSERIAVTSSAGSTVRAELQLELAVDLASVHDVKAGLSVATALAAAVSGNEARWTGVHGLRVLVRAEDALLAPCPAGVRLSWPVELSPGGSHEVAWDLHVTDPAGVVAEPSPEPLWVRPEVTADDVRLPQLLVQSLDDLDALRLALPDRCGEQFLAAGSPWFLTLFGRDSLWAARMLLPLGTELAAGTLAVLAARQGVRDDARTGEEPGKILHELRRGSFELAAERADAPVMLPPVYYGTVDATALWVLLLHDAWRWGLPAEVVETLLPALDAAMGWLTGPADADGDGFLEYVDATGRGLANQGWKDSGDSVRFRDGTLATGPIALVEVQGYAYQAAGCAAALLTAFGRPGADRWLAWRDALARRFRRTFWVEDDDGPFPAMALDGAKRAVDSLTSNAGHLLGTGLLDAAEAALVAGRMGSDDLDSGFGLRTMSSRSGGFSPLSYHCGSVWPHDTAIVISGLAREGFGRQASNLCAGLLRAGAGFEGRLPELYAGDAAADVRAPAPYPAACRPQAWSAAAGVSVLRDLLGLTVDVPAGVVRLDPLVGAPAGALRVSGLTVGTGTLDVAVDGQGRVVEVSTTSGLRVETPTT